MFFCIFFILWRISLAVNISGFIEQSQVEKRLQIETPSSKIQGYGIQAIPIKVSVFGLNTGETINVSFTASKGYFKPDQVKIRSDSVPHVMYRSQGLGKVIIRASTQGLPEVSREFESVFPFSFLIFSFLGGFIGAIVKRFMGIGSNRFFKYSGQGILTGFIVAVIWTLGVNLLNVDMQLSFNEITVLLAGFIGALFWEQIFDAIKARITGKPPATLIPTATNPPVKG